MKLFFLAFLITICVHSISIVLVSGSSSTTCKHDSDSTCERDSECCSGACDQRNGTRNYGICVPREKLSRRLSDLLSESSIKSSSSSQLVNKCLTTLIVSSCLFVSDEEDECCAKICDRNDDADDDEMCYLYQAHQPRPDLNSILIYSIGSFTLFLIFSSILIYGVLFFLKFACLIL